MEEPSSNPIPCRLEHGRRTWPSPGLPRDRDSSTAAAAAAVADLEPTFLVSFFEENSALPRLRQKAASEPRLTF